MCLQNPRKEQPRWGTWIPAVCPVCDVLDVWGRAGRGATPWPRCDCPLVGHGHRPAGYPRTQWCWGDELDLPGVWVGVVGFAYGE